MARRQFAGAVAQTTVNGSITSSQTSITVADGSTYPDGSVGPFSIVIDKGLAGEEKVLVTTRSVNTLNGCTRGYDGTAQSAHSNGATVNHCGTSIDFDEANSHVNSTAGVHGVTGAVVGTTDTQTLSGKTVNLSSNTLTGTTAQFNTALSDNDFATLAGAETLTNKTLTAPTIADHTNAQHTHASIAQGGNPTTTSSVATSENTTSVTYADLATVGPAVTITTGTNALVILTAYLQNSAANQQSIMSFAVSGATTVAAPAGLNQLMYQAFGNGAFARYSAVIPISGLTPGSNTFTAKYSVSAGTGTFANRSMTVIPLP